MTDRVDTGDETQIRKRRKRHELEALRDKEYLRQILSTVGGRLVVWNVLTKCGIYATSYQGKVKDTLWREGRRSIGLELMQDIAAADPAAYALMRDEATAREKEKLDDDRS